MIDWERISKEAAHYTIDMHRLMCVTRLMCYSSDTLSALMICKWHWESKVGFKTVVSVS